MRNNIIVGAAVVAIAAIWIGPHVDIGQSPDWGSWVEPDVVPRPGSWVVIVEESSRRSEIVAKVISNDSWQQSLKDKGLQFRLYDIDGVKLGPIAEQAKRIGLPTLVIVDENKSQILDVRKLPQSLDAIDKAIKGVTGL